MIKKEVKKLCQEWMELAHWALECQEGAWDLVGKASEGVKAGLAGDLELWAMLPNPIREGASGVAADEALQVLIPGPKAGSQALKAKRYTCVPPVFPAGGLLIRQAGSSFFLYGIYCRKMYHSSGLNFHILGARPQWYRPHEGLGQRL